MAQFVSQKSKDRSTKVGAVIVGDHNEVISIGYNGFPMGINDVHEPYHTRPTKYLVTEHAERNAIFHCARKGISTIGTKLYLNYEPIPCTDCTRAIIQCGIKEIIGPNIPFPGVGTQWKENMSIALDMLKQANVTLTYY